MPRKKLIDLLINSSSDKTLDLSTLLPSINWFILFAASGATFINSGIIEIIVETIKGLIPLPLICKSLSFFITSLSIFPP